MIQSAYIDYYIGAYGKTIIIITQSRDWLMLFKDNIVKFMDNSLDKLDVCQLNGVGHSKSISKLIIVKTENSVFPCITANSENKGTAFNWMQSEEELWNLVGLIDGLLENENPGHQYLVDESDGYTIELLYNEYPI